MVNEHSKYAIALFALLATATVGNAKTPDCANPAATTLVAQQLAKYIIDAGVPDATPAELGKVFEIANIKMTGRKEQLDAYGCEAEYITHYPKDLSSLIFKSYSTEAGQAELQSRLTKKFGDVQGAVVYGQLQSIFMSAMMASVQQSPGKADSPDGARQIVKDTLAEALDKPNPATVRYEIFPVQNGSNGATFSIKWEVDDDGGIDVPFVFYRINAAYR
jgi:hypothetical protein